MKRLYPFFLFFLIVFSLSIRGFGQSIEFSKENFPDNPIPLKEAIESKRNGDFLFTQPAPNYNLVLSHYLKAHTFNPNHATLNYRIGVCYLNLSKPEESIPFFQRTLTIDTAYFKEIHYDLGQSFQLNLDFDSAIYHYTVYKTYLQNARITEKNSFIDKKISECKVGKKLLAQETPAYIENAGGLVNTSGKEEGPIISIDGSQLFYTSCVNEITPSGLILECNEEILLSNNSNGEWESPINLGSPINTKFNDAAVGLSPDGQKLLIYKDANKGDIFETQLEGSKWSPPVSLGKGINSPSHESSAAYSYDQNTIFFDSDRIGSLGEHDIYMATKNDKGEWSNITNLGDVVNTPFDEINVFSMADGKTLFFSSNGHEGIGGYDIYKTTFENGQWTKPENLGFPINSPYHDLFFSMAADGVTAYFSSERSGGYGETDIYKITFLPAPVATTIASSPNINNDKTTSKDTVTTKTRITGSKLTLVKGIIKNKEGKAIEADIEIFDVELNQSISVFKSNSETGKFTISLPSGKNYGININAPNYLFYSENFDIPSEASYSTIDLKIEMQEVTSGSKVVLKNIFFKYNSAEVDTTSKAELQRVVQLMLKNPTITIEISGHTDSIGSALYNKRLSDNRAIAIMNALIQQGATKERLIAIGKGLDEPIAPNNTEEGRKKNRRTEFKIIDKNFQF